MDINNPIIKLCIEGTQLEYAGNAEGANLCYLKAWEQARDDYEACIAAHYLAHLETDMQERYRWNKIALEKADAVKDDRVKPFYPSLYLNMGKSCEEMGEGEKAAYYYHLAADLGTVHQSD